MNEKEAKAIEEIGLIIEAFYDFPNPQSIQFNCKDVKYLETILNLIEKQQKELENWKKYCDEQEENVTEKNNKIFDLEFKIENRKAEIEKKDKLIDLMAEWIEKHTKYYDEDGCYCEVEKDICNKNIDCKKCIKQYFERKVENGN